jgi:hypothetical protein
VAITHLFVIVSMPVMGSTILSMEVAVLTVMVAMLAMELIAVAVVVMAALMFISGCIPMMVAAMVLVWRHLLHRGGDGGGNDIRFRRHLRRDDGHGCGGYLHRDDDRLHGGGRGGEPLPLWQFRYRYSRSLRSSCSYP